MLINDKSTDYRPTTEELCRAIDSEQIYPLCAFRHDERDYDRVLVFLAMQIDEINQFYGNAMSPNAIGLCAKQIVRSYPHLTPDDLLIFTHQTLSGCFGKCYGALTPAVLMDWLATYTQWRNAEIEEIAYQEHQSHKGEEAQRGQVRYNADSATLANEYAPLILKELRKQ